MAPEGLSLRECERKLIDFIRRSAIPFGTLTTGLVVEYQNNVPVMIRLRYQKQIESSEAQVEERLR